MAWERLSKEQSNSSNPGLPDCAPFTLQGMTNQL